MYAEGAKTPAFAGIQGFRTPKMRIFAKGVFGGINRAKSQ